MKIEQKVHRIDDGPHRAGAAQLARIARHVIERLRGPYAIEVLIDEARCIGLARIETRVSIDVRERERELAAPRAQFGTQQGIDDDRAAHFVAVRERVDHHMRTVDARIERMHIRHARVARGMRADIGERDLDRVCV